MFFPAEGPPEPIVRELRALRLSLNTPVVAIDSLAVGPARAAIALHAGAPERIRVSVAVRSLRTGEIAFFSSGDEVQGLGPGVALDAALSFAEGMGFLFDDDEVQTRGARGPQEAAGLWRELTGSGPEPAPPRPAEAPERAPLGSLKLERPSPRSARVPAPREEVEDRPFWLDAVAKSEPPEGALIDKIDVFSPQLDPSGVVPPSREAPALALAPAPASGTPAPPRGGALFQLIAQTAIDRICGELPSPGPGGELPLSKFRFLRPEAPESEALLASGEALGGSPMPEPPPAPPRRSALRALQLRLLSRF